MDNAYSLPTSTLPPTLFPDPFDILLGHELGHTLSLFHGNGVDDDGDGELDEDDEGDALFGPNAINLMQYKVGTTITPAQSNRVRSQALKHVPGHKVRPMTPLLATARVDTLGDIPPLATARVDTLDDVPAGEAFIDIDSFGVATNQEIGTTTFFSSTAGLLPENISGLKYLFLADLDSNPTTGGSPAALGIPTAAQGIDVIGQVQVNVVNGSPQATPTVLTFQGGQFVAVTDSRIQATVLTNIIGLYQIGTPLLPDEEPISQNIQLEFPSDLVATMAMDIALEAMAENPNTGTIDNAEAALTFELPTFPSCRVTPPVASPGDEVIVRASDLPAGVSARVFLGPDQVATGLIHDSGSASVSFVIPKDAVTGKRPVTVRAGDTAITADSSVVIAENVNDKASFNPIRSTFTTSSDASGCPFGFVGTFSFESRLTNKSTSPLLSDLVVRVATLTNGNLLQNADGGAEGVGALLTVSQKDAFSDGVLSPEESVDVPFVICLKEKRPFTFFVDALGVVGSEDTQTISTRTIKQSQRK